ncbi:FAD/NAD(P)-binding domain-containing protein [Artomyces pyxidatus]|uniref:FAD/NAD(P)-binding domain-containing protein n=1 Tax=Artomyces pyxidatus TaxID=48021 RepID=A0ACB8TIA4_9AGAM|nr:FAD/NAD(P)-binding domain-containing protein [Artomyces pyxidatus]
MSQDKQSIVVVGGGGVGSTIARLFSQKLDPSRYILTLITAHASCILYPAAVRMTTTSDMSLEKTALIPYGRLLHKGVGTIKIGRVVRVEGTKGQESGGVVFLASGETVAYDALVVAPGLHWQGPLAFPDGQDDLLSHVEGWRSKFANASNIVVVGGGATGIEYAGEVRDYYPDKKVIIVHGGSQLLNDTYPEKYRERIEQDVRSRNVQIVFNDYVDDDKPNEAGTITTRNGKVLQADLVVQCRGGRPATELLSSLGTDVLDDRGQIRVKPTLQLHSFPSIYAAGDAIDWKEQKQIAKYDAHAAVVVDNVLAQLAGGVPKKIYKGSYEIIIITNGRYHGVGYFDVLWGIVLGNWLSSILKGRYLMVSMLRKRLGY